MTLIRRDTAMMIAYELAAEELARRLATAERTLRLIAEAPLRGQGCTWAADQARRALGQYSSNP